MKKINLVVILLILGFFSHAQENLNYFHSIKIDAAAKLNIICGELPSASGEHLSNFDLKISNDTLIITQQEPLISEKPELTIYIPHLYQIEQIGWSETTVKSINSKNLRLVVKKGRVSCSGTTRTITSNVSENADLVISLLTVSYPLASLKK